MKLVFIVFTIFALIGTAQAQLRKCTGPDGKVTYSDVLCAGNSTSTSVKPRDNTLDSSGQRESSLRLENQNLKERLSNIEKSPTQQASTGRTQFDLQAEKSGSIECQRAKQDLEATASSISANSSVLKAKRSSMHITCGTQEAATVVVRQKAQAPAIITSCDAGGCWDNLGGRYNGSGNTFVGPNGRICNRSGTMIECP